MTQFHIENRQALKIFEDVADPVYMHTVTIGLALAHFWRGDYGEALPYCQETLDLGMPARAGLAKLQALLIRSWIAARQGRLNQALADSVEALALAGQRQFPTEIAFTRSGLAQVHLAQDDLPAALEHIEQVLPHLDALPFEPLMNPFMAYLACYHTLNRSGDGRACDVLQRAWFKLMEMADRITEPATRDHFLYDVSPHREVVELMFSQGG